MASFSFLDITEMDADSFDNNISMLSHLTIVCVRDNIFNVISNGMIDKNNNAEECLYDT